jgi:hypothetical protein
MMENTFNTPTTSSELIFTESGTGKGRDDDRWFQLLKTKKFTDFKLICNQKEYHLHKCVLNSSSSEYFKTLLDSQWAESDSGQLEIPEGISVDVMDAFIVYLYTNQSDELIFKMHVFEFYELADYFQCAHLKQSLLSVISMQNLLDFVNLFKKFSDQSLEDSTVNCIAANMCELSENDFPFEQLGAMINKILKKAFPKEFAICDGSVGETWKCPECWIKNIKDIMKCVSCGYLRKHSSGSIGLIQRNRIRNQFDSNGRVIYWGEE